VGDGPKGLKLRCRCCGLVIVNAEVLGEALGDIMDFVADNVACIVMLPLADELSPQRVLAHRDV